MAPNAATDGLAQEIVLGILRTLVARVDRSRAMVGSLYVSQKETPPYSPVGSKR